MSGVTDPEREWCNGAICSGVDPAASSGYLALYTNRGSLDAISDKGREYNCKVATSETVSLLAILGAFQSPLRGCPAILGTEKVAGNLEHHQQRAFRPPL